MRKWNQDCFLKTKSKKIYLLKDEAGITLVELLAAISILSIVILLAGSIHMFGQRHFINQTDSASRSNDLTYALSVLSSDLRKEAPDLIRIESSPTKIRIVDAANQDNTLVTYEVSNNQLLKNKKSISDSVSSMTVSHQEPYSLVITLYSDGENSPDKEYSTTITLRGVNNES